MHASMHPCIHASIHPYIQQSNIIPNLQIKINHQDEISTRLQSFFKDHHYLFHDHNPIIRSSPTTGTTTSNTIFINNDIHQSTRSTSISCHDYYGRFYHAASSSSTTSKHALFLFRTIIQNKFKNIHNHYQIKIKININININ